MYIRVYLSTLFFIFIFFVLPSLSTAQSTVYTSLSIDVSGSMSGKKLQEAKNAASVYVDFTRRGDYVSIVSFSSDARVVVPNRKLSHEMDKDAIKRTVDKLVASGSTNIGAGIREALKELKKADPNSLTNIVLMTDGQHNTGDLWPHVDESARLGVPVHTIGFGTDADMRTLCEISKRTGGFCFYADEHNLSYVYHRAGLVVYNISPLLSFSDILKPGRSQDYPLFISDDVKDIVLFIHWINGNLGSDIIDSTGKKVQIVEEKTGANYRIIKLSNLRDRNIVVRLNPINVPYDGTQVNVSVSGDSPIYASVIGLKPHYNLRENVEIRVALGLVKDGRRIPIDGIKPYVEITKPTEELIKKESNGIRINIAGHILSQVFKKERVDMHYEGNGIFVGNFKSTNLNGPYVINVRIDGEVEGKQFSREFKEIFYVGKIEESKITVSDIFSLMRNIDNPQSLQIDNPLKNLKERLREIPLPIPKF